MKNRTLLLLLAGLNVAYGADQALIAQNTKAPVTNTQSNAPVKPMDPDTGKLDWPWLTGPLIMPNGAVVPVGHFFIQNYANFDTFTGIYDSDWNSNSSQNDLFTFNPQIIAYVGVTQWMDVFVAPQAFVSTFRGESAGRFGDFPVGVDFQPIPVDTSKWYPGVKLTIKESFPTGKYENLNPNNLGTDISGTGTYQTTFSVLLHNVYHIWKSQFLSLYAYGGYTVNSSVHVHGFNAYGGGNNTSGKVHGGNTVQGIFSIEYAFTRQFALVMDTVYTHVDAVKFSGTPGTTNDGLIANPGLRSSESLAFAPAIEYNFNEHYGLVVGCYLSAAGRNSPIFRNGIAELTIGY